MTRDRGIPQTRAESTKQISSTKTDAPKLAVRTNPAIAATHAGVTIRTLETVSEFTAAVNLFAKVWGLQRGDELVSTSMLRAMAHAGNYVAAAFDGVKMVGGCFGFLGAHDGRTLHSHLSGVDPAQRGRGIGTAIKLHQRHWALERGIDCITWTFDPLVARNAHVNLAILGATADEYLTDFYGSLADTVNAGERTDRLLIRWNLREPAPTLSTNAGEDVLSVGANGQPLRHNVGAHAAVVRAQIPSDLVTLRSERPELTHVWRTAVGDILGEYLERGWRIMGFDREHRYLLEKP